jgi:cytochrome c oxidase subunit 4
LTVAISFLELSPSWHLTLGLSIATVKAALVLLFFMHVLHSSPQTRVAIGAAILWLAILFSLTLTDYLTRGQVPRMPGH